LAPPAATSPLSLHDALPIYLDPHVLGEEVDRVRGVHHDPADLRRREDHVARAVLAEERERRVAVREVELGRRAPHEPGEARALEDRKSTRLNSSHVKLSYAV